MTENCHIFLELASSILGRPSPGTRPARSLTYLEVLNRILYLAQSSEARVIRTGGYGGGGRVL